jgi:hypothetical protein
VATGGGTKTVMDFSGTAGVSERLGIEDDVLHKSQVALTTFTIA